MEKLYNLKKGITIVLFCIAITFIFTGCGTKKPSNDTSQNESTENSVFRLQTEDGYYDFNIIKTDEYEYRGSMHVRYYTEEDYVISFTNTGCSIYLSQDDYYDEKPAATYKQASIKKLDLPITWKKADKETIDKTNYQTLETEKEKPEL